MEKEIPLFPLNIVAFPGEELNLHIFEPRYKQLIEDCETSDKIFGIPSYINNKVEYGTEVEIIEITKRYSDGRSDVKTKATQIFKVIDFQNPWSKKLYAGGSIAYISHDLEEDPALKLDFLALCKELFSWLQMSEKIKLDHSTNSFTVGHKIGLKLEEEYELLKIGSEVDRQHFIIKHLETMLPALERAEEARERIKLNGHFKHLDPLKF